MKTITLYDEQDMWIALMSGSSATQDQVAAIYADLIELDCLARAAKPELGFAIMFKSINAAIRKRWPGKTSLSSIKSKAWRLLEKRSK